jgi:hypothetical protein
MASNKLIVIGWSVESKRCYLNVSREEAVRRYSVSEKYDPDPILITEINFDDEFCAYRVYEKKK